MMRTSAWMLKRVNACAKVTLGPSLLRESFAFSPVRNVTTPTIRDNVVAAAVNNILYDTPAIKGSKSRHVLTALVNNEPGVLSRISGVLAARAVNIDSLVVGETEVKQLSRTTLVLKAGEDVEQVKKQLEDIVQVWAVVEYDQNASIIERELILIKINCGPSASSEVHPFMGSEAGKTDLPNSILAPEVLVTRASLVELTKLFGGKIVDVAPQHLTVELTAKASRIDAFLALMKPYGIRECARTGVLAMLRGSMSGFEDEEIAEEEEDAGPDATMLPPG